MTIEERVDAVSWQGHQLLLHDSPSSRRAAVRRWIGRGLTGGAKVVCSLLPDPDDGRSVVDLIAEEGTIPAFAVQQGHLEVLPLEQFYAPSTQSALVERARDQAYRSVRLLAEAAAARAVLSEADYDRFEHVLTELSTRPSVSAVCMYAEADSTGSALDTAIERHTDGVCAPLLQALSTQDGILVRGEVDVLNAEVLAGALRAAAQRYHAVLRVDLGGVAFFGAAGCGALLAGTRTFRQAGGTVVLGSLPPLVAQVIGLARLDKARGLTVAAHGELLPQPRSTDDLGG